MSLWTFLRRAFDRRFPSSAPYFIRCFKASFFISHNFYNALCNWKDGNKLQISLEEAEKMNCHFKNAKMIVEQRVSTAADTLVDWMAFPNNDPTICYYIGLTFDSELCKWAEQYK